MKPLTGAGFGHLNAIGGNRLDMTDLLIHSMSEFADIILSSLSIAGARDIVEIGAEFGGMSQRLGEFAAAVSGSLTSIDPAPKAAFTQWSEGFSCSRHIAATSLKAIPTLSNVDAWIIDGDHNYYTVHKELQAIDAIARRDAKPLLVFLHDVGWPCSRRDCYYNPEQIPAEHRHPFDYYGGVVLVTDPLLPNRGFRGGVLFAFATTIGGPGNGVLTAVEDFVAEESKINDRAFGWCFVPAVFGLGILFDIAAPWSSKLAEAVLLYHNNPLLASLERNRLANYLKVLDYQDGYAR